MNGFLTKKFVTNSCLTKIDGLIMELLKVMLKYLLFNILLLLVTNAKPIQDVDSIGPHYKKLADNVDSKLKYVQEIGNEKTKPIEFEEELVTTQNPIPTIQLLTTPIIDSKLDEEIDEDSSSEEENEHTPTETINATSSPNFHENSQRLSVEEHEDVFDDKQEILAKKPMPQIIRTANTLPTILPQTANAPKPTISEPPTTSIPHESLKNNDSSQNDSKQKSLKSDKSKPSNTSMQAPKQQTEQKSADKFMNGENEEFGPKTHENHNIIYGQNQLMPELHDKLAPTFMPPLMTTPSLIIQTTENPVDEESTWKKILKGIRCSHGDCEGVLVSTTPSGPRELKPSKIIRRARRQDEIVVCRCLNN